MTVAFDTLKLADRLEGAGMPSQQAKGVAAALAETLTGAVATAADLRESELRLRSEIREVELRLRSEIREVESRLRTEIGEVESRLRSEIATVRTEISDLRAEILKWVIGAIGFQTVVILGAVAALIRLLH
jgi:chromosome segregation ATPase